MRFFYQLTLPALALAVLAPAQNLVSLPQPGNNQRNTTTVTIGLVKVGVEYSSPAVHGPGGRDRRGHIWGELVPYGLVDLGYNDGKKSPWRAGANENTVFSVSHEVVIDGRKVPAGSYGVHMIPEKDEWTVVLSKESTAWGSFFYDPARDFMRFQAKPAKHEYREWLTWEFPVRRPTEARIELQWEDLAIGWDIKVPNSNELYISRLRDDLNTGFGFDWRAYDQAAQFTLQANYELEQGLKWAEIASSRPGVSLGTFSAGATKFLILNKLNRTADAKTALDALLKLPAAQPQEIHQLARQLQIAKNNELAAYVYKANGARFGDVWPVHVGLGRAAAMAGDSKGALEHFRKALGQAPDDLNRKNLEGYVKTLEEGKSIPQ